MTQTDDAWAWFDEQPAPAITPSAMSRDLQKAFARLLAYPEAEAVLNHLHSVTRNRIFGPDTSDAVLRYAEGQKALVAYMERMATTGRGGHTPVWNAKHQQQRI